jgi:hypothetical protein
VYGVRCTLYAVRCTLYGVYAVRWGCTLWAYTHHMNTAYRGQALI